MEIRKYAMHYGAVLGLFLVLIALLLWILDIDEKQSIIPSILNNIVIIIFLFYSLTQYRDVECNGFISYGSVVKLGTSVSFFSAIIMAFYTFIYISYLDPDFLSEILHLTEQSILENNPEISDEEIDLALSMTNKLMQPHWMMILGVLGSTFTGFIISLILSFFVKRNQPVENI